MSKIDVKNNTVLSGVVDFISFDMFLVDYIIRVVIDNRK